LRLSDPAGRIGPSAFFGEHVVKPNGRSLLYAIESDVVRESKDGGRTWKSIPLTHGFPVDRCFTTSTGKHIVCSPTTAEPGDLETAATVQRLSGGWQPNGRPLKIRSHWHGSCSIGEANGVIMFAEYPINRGKYGTADHLPLSYQLVSDPRVFRSRDDGRTWDVCFEVSAETIRHLHTVCPDPEVPHRWWLTSGDRPPEVFVWVSNDDGDTWTDVTAEAPDRPLHPTATPRSAQRMTDQVFHEGYMIWGSDDLLGNARAVDSPVPPRVGSRIYRARTEGPWQPEEIGFCGPPIRSIVDVGPAWLFISEAKNPTMTLCPQSYLVFKDELDRVHRFVQLDNWVDAPTGFTYSRSSRRADKGVFFSHRGSRDVFSRGPNLLRWEIEFF
jgi:hypothetical protein